MLILGISKNIRHGFSRLDSAIGNNLILYFSCLILAYKGKFIMTKKRMA